MADVSAVYFKNRGEKCFYSNLARIHKLAFRFFFLVYMYLKHPFNFMLFLYPNIEEYARLPEQHFTSNFNFVNSFRLSPRMSRNSTQKSHSWKRIRAGSSFSPSSTMTSGRCTRKQKLHSGQLRRHVQLDEFIWFCFTCKWHVMI